MKKIFLMLATATVCLTACNTETDEPVAPSAKRIAISPGITFTRATEMNFEEGDRIGLTIIRADQSLHVENAMLTHDGDVFIGNAVWYTETNEESHMVAYHPYDESGAPTTFTVALDQSGDGYGKSDLMGASKPNVAPSASSVGMLFKHLLTKINVNVTNESDADVTSIVLQGAIPTADVDLKGLTVEVDDAASPANIITQQLTKNTLHRAIIVPQQVALTVVVTTSDGKTLSQPLTTANFKSKAQYNVAVTVTAEEELEATISGEIFGWTDEGTIGPAEEEQPGERLHTITFEGPEWEPLVAVNYNGGTYTNVVHDNYTYPLWVDETTKLTTDYPTWFNDDRDNSMGFDYPWILSSYTTNTITPEKGWYQTDLYIYNADNGVEATHGGGNNGSDNFLVAFGYYEPEGQFSLGDYRPVFKFADGQARTIKSIYINSTVYFLSVVAEGNSLSPALAPGESVWWDATGLDADGNELGTIRRTFASYENIITEWTQWDLSELGPVVALKLNQGGETDNGYGYSLPAYYAIDDITVVME
jgi:hypothetical protein